MSVAEKVGLPNYSNVDIGPAVVERFVEDNPEAIKKGLAECLLHAQEIVFTEAEAVRNRGGEARTRLLGKIDNLSPENKNKVVTKLVGLGVVNSKSPAEALAALSVEKVPELERFIDSLGGMNVPSA